jgi:hypothetical protein
MQHNKILIPRGTFDINLKFYYFLKHLVKTKLSDNQAKAILRLYSLNIKNDYSIIIPKVVNCANEIIKKPNSKKLKLFLEIIEQINNHLDLRLFIFSLKLYMIKDLLLAEAKAQDLFDISKLEKISPLSIEYDKITIYSPYSTRVNGALLSLIFFERLHCGETNFISQVSEDFLISLSSFAIELKNHGVEPNQIFMLMFSESVNQSIISDSGYNYEERIAAVLESIGIDKNSISKTHDKNDSSTEFDFFFELNNKTYGIGAKRTLRERYKQFIKTAQMTKIDVMIQVTLGIDLTEEKVKAIRNHQVFLFVAEEVYNNYEYLQKIVGVYSTKDLNISTLETLSSNFTKSN